MRIVHVIDTIDPRYGGPPAVAVQLSSAQVANGHDVTLVFHGAEGSKIPDAFAWVPHCREVRTVAVPREGGLDGLRMPEGNRQIEPIIASADVVHMHGVWEPLLWSAADHARRNRVPYIVRPAGMLDPWSLSQKWLKKRLALLVGFRRMLEHALFVHALNRDERDLVGLLGLSCPVEILPNGVFLEVLSGIPPAGTFRKKFPALGDAPFVLFLSRLHYKKGLDYLADAYQSIARRIPDVKLVVAGPDDGAQEGFERKIQRYGLSDRVVMAGPMYARDKLAALNDATVFCLPSRQEGFSVAIVEALAVGLPVVISEGCHFPEVAEEGAGRVVALDSRSIGEALLKICQDSTLRQSMSQAGKRMVEESYTWPKIAEYCVERYEYRRQKRRTGTTRDERSLRILHVVKSLDPTAGGPPVIAVKLATAQAQLGHDVHMLSYRVPAAEKDIKAMLQDLKDGRPVEQHYLPPASKWETLAGSIAGKIGRTLVREFDVVHLHGLWEPLLMRIAHECRRAGIAYVVTPHGMLDPWSLSQSRAKKRIALRLAVKRMINGSAFVHFGNRDEVDLVRPLGLTAKGELIPNGVFPSEVQDAAPTGAFRKAFPQLGDKPYVLFLSRLHFKKGLDFLASSFTLLAPRLPDVQLVVAGPDGGARAEFERDIAKAGLKDRVHLVGPIYGKLKTAAVVEAAVFCLPSRQEGFSMAITEALGLGCPCVVSTSCHFPEVGEVGAGHVVELDAQQIADALYDVLKDPAARDAIGDKGRELVLSRFTWPVIAETAVRAYLRHSHLSGLTGTPSAGVTAGV